MSDMSIKEAIEWLTQAVPIRALTEEDFAKFIKAVNMAIDSLEADEAYQLEYEPTTKNDLGVDWESYKDADGNSLDDLILEVLKNNFDCGNTYGYKVADEIIELLPSVTPQEPINSVLEDIKKEILLHEEEHFTKKDDIIPRQSALNIIDKHISRKEESAHE